jgi:hypothetical protein
VPTNAFDNIKKALDADVPLTLGVEWDLSVPRSSVVSSPSSSSSSKALGPLSYSDSYSGIISPPNWPYNYRSNTYRTRKSIKLRVSGGGWVRPWLLALACMKLRLNIPGTINSEAVNCGGSL